MSSKMRTFNYWARGVLESGSYDNAALLITDKLGGVDQIIGISDTGLDLNSVYFYDNVTITPDAATANTQHRKVVSYSTKVSSTCCDFTDVYDGHGTHGRTRDLF